MAESTREVLNRLYRPIADKLDEIIMALTKLHSDFKVTSGFFNGHYHKNSAGQYGADAYPIPVISVMGLCDLEIDFDGISVTTKLSRDQIKLLDWGIFGNIPFELYGVENYLNDYGSNQNTNTIADNIRSSPEKEFFVSFSFSSGTSGNETLEFLRILQRNHFYY